MTLSSFGFDDQLPRQVDLLSGFARGGTLTGDDAGVTTSLRQWDRSFTDLRVAEMLEQRGATSWRGLRVIDLCNEDVVTWVGSEGDIMESLNVALFRLAVPWVSRMTALIFPGVA